MLKRLTSVDEIADAERRITELIEAHAEWCYAPGAGGAPVALSRGEIDVHVAQGRLIFSCWTEKGVRSWRVRGWEWTGAKLTLEAARRAGAERALLELVPRASAKATNALISAARRERAQRLAQLACSSIEGASVDSVALSAGARRAEPGRYARIVLRLNQERIAVTGVVTPKEVYEVDAFLSSTLIWFMRASESARAALIWKLWLVADPEHIKTLAERVALLRRELRRVISLFEIDDEWQVLKPVRCPEQAELWTGAGASFRRPSQAEPGETAARILALAPDAIDVVRARHGETLRFNGLPFARVRRLMGTERVWFGVEGASKRRLLDESTARDWDDLLAQLNEHRRADASDHRHALYRSAPEAWLESMLRRDITRLDPGLRLAPLYAQFRASQGGAIAAASRPVDLLALRRDGRLVVIELKVSEDREHVLQGVDYWRRVETHRRSGSLARAHLFGDAAITDEPPLVYLVAPTLRFHRAFQLLAHAIDPLIEIYRFDINEDWRAAGVRVMLRLRLDTISGSADLTLPSSPGRN
ncbi:MAG TPA: hypothetical protein VIW80_18630 [Pyrinomonadaceae bacterium]|jgi:hypothetical protein